MNVASAMLAAKSSSGTNYLPFLLIAGLFVITYFIIIRPQSKRRKAMVDMQSTLGPGAEVVTIGGMYATVVAADDDTLYLEIAPGVSARYARGAIARVTTPAPEAEQPETPAADEADVVEAAEPAPQDSDVVEAAEAKADEAAQAAAEPEAKPAKRKRAAAGTAKEKS